MPIVVRKSGDRGHADHGWLDSYHTFSFANYQDSNFMGFNSLRVINEDRVAPSEGFGTHSHKEMEIFSYILSGELEHKDSLGHREVIQRGQVQFTSAGTGLSHSEFNASDANWVHFLQIWVKPAVSGLKPSYQTKNFPEEEKKNKLRLVVAPDGANGSVHINQDLKMYASILSKGEKVTYNYESGRAGYIHVANTQNGIITINDVRLLAGDGAFINDLEKVEIKGESENAEFILFEMKSLA